MARVLVAFCKRILQTSIELQPYANMLVARVLRMFCDMQHVRPTDATHAHRTHDYRFYMHMRSVKWSHMLRVAKFSQDSSHRHIRVWRESWLEPWGQPGHPWAILDVHWGTSTEPMMTHEMLRYWNICLWFESDLPKFIPKMPRRCPSCTKGYLWTTGRCPARVLCAQA